MRALNPSEIVQTPAQVAESALELLSATHQRIHHLYALFNSIIKDLNHGKSRDVEVLANLGSFLGYDWADYVDGEVVKLQKELDATKVSQ